MKKNSLFAISVLVIQIAHAQVSTLEVHGEAKIKVIPDVGILKANFQYVGGTMNQSIIGLNSFTKQLYEEINKLGYGKEDLETANFNVRANTIYRKGERIDSGYISKQDLLLRFETRDEKIQKILTFLSESDQGFNISFDFEISTDLKSNLKDKLLKLALDDAYDSANKIAGYSNHTVKRVVTITDKTQTLIVNEIALEEEVKIDYEQDNNEIAGFNPKKIELKKKLFVVFEIESSI